MTVRVTSLALAVLVLATPAAATEAAPVTPTITITRATITPRTVDVRARFCTIIGPGSRIVTTETRTLGGRVLGRARSIDPLGVDLETDAPYQCVGNYMLAWLRPKQVQGRGTYTAALYVEDSRRRKSRSVFLRLAN